MSDIINLRQFKKAKARTENEKLAAANRAKFGATKSEKAKLKMEDRQIERTLDGARLSSKPDDTIA
jgi:hypothetical protein